MSENLKVYYTLHKKKLVKSTINVDLIIGFGYFHEREYTKKDTFKGFAKYGYIKTPNKRYTVSKYDVAELMKQLKGKYEILRKKVMADTRNGRPIEAINWDYTVKKAE
jgi:hypothetical protein